MAFIDIKDLSFKYSLSDKFVLSDINLSINKGDFVLICGDSGCGKSTLIRHLKKELIPYGSYKGEVLLEEKPINEMELRESATTIGYVMQNPENQIVTDKVWHELAFGLENIGEEMSDIRRKVAEIANYFGIQELFRKETSDLSGGQKQIINLASTLLLDPMLLILDEPTSQLDPIVAADFINTLKKINEEFYVTIVIVEHRLEDLMKIANKVVVMDEGKITAIGNPQDISNKLMAINPKHTIFDALPISMRVATYLKVDHNIPLTIKDGRDMLLAHFKEIEYTSLEIEEEVKSSKEVVKMDNVYFRYTKNGDDVLRGVNLSVNEGELYCVIGGNGSGKTTAINNIAGLLKPYRGKIFIDGKDIRKDKISKGEVGYLPQNPTLLFYQDSVIKDLEDVIKDDRKNYDDNKAKLEQLILELNIQDILNQHPYDISGGEQQKVALAKLLLNDPKILLLDEPTKGLDATSKKLFAKILDNLTKQGITILLISHDIDFCAEYASRCAFFFDGDIISVDTPNKFFRNNSFYTTSATKLTKYIFDNTITYKEVVMLCSLNQKQ